MLIIRFSGLEMHSYLENKIHTVKEPKVKKGRKVSDGV